MKFIVWCQLSLCMMVLIVEASPTHASRQFRENKVGSPSATTGKRKRPLAVRRLSKKFRKIAKRGRRLLGFPLLRNRLRTHRWKETDSSSSTLDNSKHQYHVYNPLGMYLTCMSIVSVWVTTGTLFYSYCNDWPLAQSFFYAIDAGMSVGFCTDVKETKLVSKAFTILFILLGASVVGGALALFIQDAVEGLSTPTRKEYQVLLENSVFDKADVDQTGVLTFDQFQALTTLDGKISDEDVQRLWTKFDHLKDGVIHFEEFVGSYRGIERLVASLQEEQLEKVNPLRRLGNKVSEGLHTMWQLEHRIYFCFLVWLSVGILWGILDQHWDPITATHFAVSALATGGLTAPVVNKKGILPVKPAIFCGVYCLLGIPLMALTLGHFARVLVADHVAAMEASALTRPLSRDEFDLAMHLTTKDSVVHLSDFVVLQLLRQGKLTIEAIEVLKQNFEMLDSDRSGTLTLEQATQGKAVDTKTCY